MKLITQSLEYEGNNHTELRTALTQFYQQEPFSTGLDWQNQYIWAKMTDEQALMFLLKHPEYVGRFKSV